MVLTWVLAATACLGGVAAALGLVRYIRDGRRMGALASAVMGTCGAVLAVGILLLQQGHQTPLLVMSVAGLVLLMLGTLIGYPSLMLFLLWSGVTVLRREGRTSGNALALLAGVGLVVLPFTLRALEPVGDMRDDFWYILRYGLHSAAILLVMYATLAFATFLAASLLYRWRRPRFSPEAVIVLGSGLIEGEVPPLLAGRLRRGLDVQRACDSTPLLITSGGQGTDEPRPEGVAMREYLIDGGARPESVLAEDQSRNTRENLEFSRQLLSSGQAPVLIVTSSYHVFRAALLSRALNMRAHVLGSKTAWYYFPSALLREFAGVMREQLRVHCAAAGLLVVLAVVSSFLLVPLMIPPAGA